MPQALSPPSPDQGSLPGRVGGDTISQALEMEARGLGYSHTEPHYLCLCPGCLGLSWELFPQVVPIS